MNVNSPGKSVRFPLTSRSVVTASSDEKVQRLLTLASDCNHLFFLVFLTGCGCNAVFCRDSLPSNSKYVAPSKIALLHCCPAADQHFSDGFCERHCQHGNIFFFYILSFYLFFERSSSQDAKSRREINALDDICD